MNSRRIFTLSFLFLLSSACAKHESTSQTKIVNGAMAWYHEQPAVVTLYDSNLDAICTGTFLNDREVLTAAHCTEAFDVDFDTGLVDGTLFILFVNDLAHGNSEIRARSERIIRNPAWDRAGSGVNSADLAIVTFPKGTWGTSAKISSRPAEVGDEVELFGYGLDQDTDSSDISSAGVFRKGYNTIEDISGGMIMFEGYGETVSGDGSFASSGHGDSGGPLLVNGEMVGIVSGGFPPDYSSDFAINYYVDLHSETSQSFLKYALSFP